MGLFSDLPIHNQLDVLKKLDFQDFVRFKQCSSKSRETASRLRHRIPLKVKKILFDREKVTVQLEIGKKEHSLSLLSGEPVRLDVEQFTLHSKLDIDQQKYLEDMVERMEIRAHVLRFLIYKEDCNTDTNDLLIKILGVEVLIAYDYKSSDLLRLTQLETIKEIEFLHGEMKDPDFLALQQPAIKIIGTRVTPLAANQFFKQWLNGQRRIKELEIFPIYLEYSEFKVEDSELFEDLDFTFLWWRDRHNNSCFGHLPIEPSREKLEFIYTLTRIEDGQKVFMALGRFRLVAREYEDIKEIEEWIGTQNAYSYRWNQRWK